jgi:hypothetical protein
MVILGNRRPWVVDFISRIAEAFGLVVPMPALPVEGNVFVCVNADDVMKLVNKTVNAKPV